MKRLFDIFFSLLALIVIAPFMIPIIIILRFTGEGEIFYVQQRVGQGGKLFGLLKFATMLKDSPNLAGGDITMANDPRVLPLGHFLRKTKINELPQLWNILVGDISLVGPRPMTPRNISYYPEYVQQGIIDIKPGLTGIGSIVFRDEEAIIANSHKEPLNCFREDISPYNYKGELELWYKENQSFWLDIKLIVLTALVVVKPQSEVYRKWCKGLPEKPDWDLSGKRAGVL